MRGCPCSSVAQDDVMMKLSLDNCFSCSCFNSAIRHRLCQGARYLTQHRLSLSFSASNIQDCPSCRDVLRGKEMSRQYLTLKYVQRSQWASPVVGYHPTQYLSLLSLTSTTSSVVTMFCTLASCLSNASFTQVIIVSDSIFTLRKVQHGWLRHLYLPVVRASNLALTYLSLLYI